MRFVTIVLITLALFGCKQKSETKPSQEASAPVASEQAMSRGAAAKSDDGKLVQDEDVVGGQPAQPGQALGHVGLVAPVGAPGRLLEYNVAVHYRSADLLKARALLYSIASRRGFLRSSSASAESSQVSVEMAVRSTELYDTLKDLDAAGDLLTENISVTDHTEADYGNSLKVKRENLRGARRTQAMTGDAAARNWAEREAALERSEDSSDQAQLEKWKIQDHVNWATISVQVSGPDLPAPIRVPSYRNAFVGLLNVILELGYMAIYILPFLLIGLLLIAKRRTWLGWIKRG